MRLSEHSFSFVSVGRIASKKESEKGKRSISLGIWDFEESTASFWQYVKESECNAWERNQIQKGAGEPFVGGTRWRDPDSNEIQDLAGENWISFGLFFTAPHWAHSHSFILASGYVINQQDRVL